MCLGHCFPGLPLQSLLSVFNNVTVWLSCREDQILIKHKLMA